MVEVGTVKMYSHRQKNKKAIMIAWLGGWQCKTEGCAGYGTLKRYSCTTFEVIKIFP